MRNHLGRGIAGLVEDFFHTITWRLEKSLENQKEAKDKIYDSI